MVDLVTGSDTVQIRRYGHERLPTYGRLNFGVIQVTELQVLAAPSNLLVTDGSMPVLADVCVRNAAPVRLICINLRSVQRHDHVGFLLNNARLGHIAHMRHPPKSIAPVVIKLLEGYAEAVEDYAFADQ